MTELKNALLHSLLRKDSLCCLCFNVVGSDRVQIDDEVMVDDDAFSNIQLLEVLTFILGCDVIDNLPFQSLCENCVVTAIHSYMFIKRCRENAETLQHAVENLENCLQNAEDKTDGCKSIFLSLDANCEAQMYCDYRRPVNSLLGALARFKYVSTDKYNGKYYVESSPKHQPKSWIALDLGHNLDDEFDNEFSMHSFKSEKTKTRSAKGRKHKMEFLSDYVMFHKSSTPKNYVCNGCNKTFDSVTILRMHYMRVHAPKKIRCPKCDRKFATKMLLENHLSVSHADAVCFECGKTFTNIASLKKHELSHKSAKYVCRTCHRVYKTLKTIRDHVNNGICERGGRLSRKPVNVGPFTCDICNTHFTSKNAVRSHLITKHGSGSDSVVHTCPWCDKRFMAASSLKGHIVKHTGERKFQCDLCDEKFVTQPALVNHTRLHTGEKPYSCDYCEECFVSTSRRMEHLRRKHLEPSLPCRLCSAIFKSGAGKRKHERRHFNPSSKLYVPKDQRPEGIKEPKETSIECLGKKKFVTRITSEK